MRNVLLLMVLLALSVPAGSIPAAAALPAEVLQIVPVVADDEDAKDEEATEEKGEKEEELTLERLFPEKSFFGPSARSTAFSHDGRYAAYLYRPYLERRHGSDLWIYDVEAGESKRITMVSVMSEFQEATRKVREDRIEKAKKKKKGEKEGEEKKDGRDDEAAEPVDDGVSGQWEGKLTEGQDIGLPPEGLAFTLTLKIGDDDSVSGTLITELNSNTITDGTYDRETGELTCTLTDPESGMTASLSAIIKGGALEGTVTISAIEFTLKLSAKRTSALEIDDREEEEGEGDAEREEDGDGVEEEDEQEEQDLGDVVDEKDADDDKAPRYGGVSGFVWAPESQQLIFTSGGDLYQYDVQAQSITRLTKTNDGERAVQYLPDGSGYSYLRSNALIKVTFGSHLIEQIDPKLPGGENLNGYSISPDGKAIAFKTTKGESFWSRGRKVNIVSYRDRFAQVRQVTRHVSDDPIPDFFWSVYLYDMRGQMAEEGKLSKLFTLKQAGPRDYVGVPAWSPDSSRVAFAAFEQASAIVRILEAKMPEPEEEDEADDGKEAAEGDDGEKPDDESDEAEKEPKEAEEKAVEVGEAVVVYRFLHNGGPTTPDMINPLYLPDNRRMVFLTELSGFRQLHVLDPVYEQLDQLTRGRFEVYPLGVSKDHRYMFALATKEQPTARNAYRIDLAGGEMTRLDTVDGYYSTVAVSNDGEHVLANFADFGSPVELRAFDAGAEEVNVLTDSHTEEAMKLTQHAPEFFTYTNRHGQEIYGHMFKPDDWTPDDQRPLLIYVYGGPLGTQKQATRGSFSSSSYFFAYYMAKKHGYITCTIDPRGVSGYGGLYEKSNYEQVGKPQVEDLVDGAKWFIENHGVDPARVGIHGWSFGGFQTQMCLYTEPDVFACGMAGAGPTEWENYNSWYSTGTIGPSRTGKTDLEKFSLLPLAKNLKGRLLLVHGMEDPNVLYQDTVRVYRELLKAGKETLVELFLDPTGGHGLGGDVKRLGRYRKYEEFLLRVLGTGAPVAGEDDEDEDEPVDEDGDAEAEGGHEDDDDDDD